MTIRRMIATVFAAAVFGGISLLGLISSLEGPETRIAAPAGTVADVVTTVSEAPVVGPVVRGAVRPH